MARYITQDKTKEQQSITRGEKKRPVKKRRKAGLFLLDKTPFPWLEVTWCTGDWLETITEPFKCR